MQRSKPEVRQSSGIRSLSGFVANHGQWEEGVLFFGRAGGIDATLTTDAIVFRPAPPDPESGRPWPLPLVLRLPSGGQADGEGMLPTLHHFLVGDRSRWASNVPGFDQVVYRGIAPGIDLVLRVEGGEASGPERFAYDLRIAPGSDLAALALDFEGAKLVGEPDGAVLGMQAAAGAVQQHIGACWQVDSKTGGRQPLDVRFEAQRVCGDTLRVGFIAAARDPSLATVIDPSLAWATYIGSPTQDFLKDVEVDAFGATYLTCRALSALPTTPGAIQTIVLGITDNWIGKLSATGALLEWGTFLGGTDVEEPFGLDLSKDGSLVLLGGSFSSDFPTTPGVLQPLFLGASSDLTLSRIDAAGSSILWSTFFGGPNGEDPRCSALFPNGDILIVGEPDSALPGSTPGAFDTTYAEGKQFVARIAADGSSVVFQSYFRASRILDAATDENGDVYFVGNINGIDFPLPATPDAFMTAPSSMHAEGFVAKLSGDGSKLRWSTYFGGPEGSDAIWGIAIDAANSVYVAGQTSSDDLPTTAGAFANVSNGSSDGFVAKFLPGGTGLVWSTYIGSCCGGGGLEWDVRVGHSSTHPLFKLAFQGADHGYAIGSRFIVHTYE